MSGERNLLDPSGFRILYLDGNQRDAAATSHPSRHDRRLAGLGSGGQRIPLEYFSNGTAGARFIGYGIGMFAAARAPSRHRVWINTMIAIQAVDFLATLGYLANGVLPAHHFALTLWLPLLWVVLLSWASLRSRTAAEPDSVDRQTAASGSKSRP